MRAILKQIKYRICVLRNHLYPYWHKAIFGTHTRYAWLQQSVIKSYKLFDFSKHNPARVIIYMSETTEFAGLADRFKTFVNGYILAQENNRNLFIYHDKGFPLEKYLIPHEVNWQIKPSEICWGLNKVKLLWFDTFPLILKKKNKEYHGYALYADLAPALTPEQREKYAFDKVFNKLFRPSAHLTSLVESAMTACRLRENQFIAVHIRFLNFFEIVEKSATEITGTPNQQEQMILDIHATLEHIHRQTGGEPILLFSDSNRFLEALHPAYVKILPGTVGHISRLSGADEITDKAFTDMFVMSKARHIYRILGDNIYAGGFAQTAARIAGKTAIDITYTSTAYPADHQKSAKQ